MTIRLRQLAAALLFDGTKVLLMHKRGSKWQRQTSPFYAAIGGHMEEGELNDPYAACLREIEEETGLRERDIVNLRLKYILLRLKENEIRQQFIYVGEALRTDVTASEEGELEWHELENAMNLHSSAIHHAMLRHYRDDPLPDQVYTGTMSIAEDGSPSVQWHPLRDPRVF
ncbi:NUDIX domain-containing protein [Paenibacillus methanolicus]|uniref:8-oxo-dGTP diphosphatase n=1 Tax=Paenibacillus methanolicus TaxID=582686 RepID=A0A5S5C573_9BACL|nr:NUDIX domain-containing protein [Paenibacillus methanolicus]TYP73758.1 8-oxo-dGTP diphosphatase [Paenibacillus methanolicus]